MQWINYLEKWWFFCIFHWFFLLLILFFLIFLFLIFQIYIWRATQLFDGKSIDRMKNYWFRLVANEIQLAKLLHSDFIASERRIWNDLPLNGDIWSIVCYFSKRRPNESNINICSIKTIVSWCIWYINQLIQCKI